MMGLSGRQALRVGLLGLSLVLAIVAAELIVRAIDGQPLFQHSLPAPVPGPSPDAERETADLRHLAGIPLADGVDLDWYFSDPPAVEVAGPDPRPGIEQRRIRYAASDPYGALMVWNRAYLRTYLCAGHTFGSLSILEDFYVFDAPDGSEYPIYRHLPHLQADGWFPPNNLGFRGSDVSVRKPADAIRIAFVGASTTVGPYHHSLAHTELLEHWLNLWAGPAGYRVEMLNAARTGINVHSIAAIVEQELLPLEPDLVVYYEGANSFHPDELLRPRPGVLGRGPRANISPRWRLEDHSALLRRIRLLVDVVQGSGGWEPRKPRHEIEWPPDVDEEDPDVTRDPLPMSLHVVVGQLDRMRSLLAAIDTPLAVASFVWMVDDRLELELPRDLVLYNFLNSTYHPLTYAQLRRAADFQNRVFRNFARLHGLPFFDVAALSPLDPLLFGDAIHMTPQGLRLQAWIYLQALVPWLEAEIAAGRLPRAMRQPHDEPLTGPLDTPELVPRAALLTGCP